MINQSVIQRRVFSDIEKIKDIGRFHTSSGSTPNLPSQAGSKFILKLQIALELKSKRS